MRTVAVVVAVAAISSCSSTGESGASIAPQPVDTVRTNAANGAAATFGVPAVVGDLKITASNPVVETDEGGPWLTLTVRAENRSPSDVQSPQLELRCAGSSSGGTWLETSTFKQGEPVPAGAFTTGNISLLVPGDERLGDPRPSCATPATVVATILAFDNAGASAPVQKRVAWAVPDELIGDLNGAPQQSGPYGAEESLSAGTLR
jgi:hypothetical protein